MTSANPIPSDRVIRIGLVDDHVLFTDALSLVIARESDLEFIWVAHSINDAQRLIQSNCPTLLVIDINLPDGNGLDLVPALHPVCPETQVLVLSSYTDESNLMRAISIGVSGFIDKTRPVTELLTAIRQTADGEIAMPRRLLTDLLTTMMRERAVQAKPARYEALTPREREILRCAAQGSSTVIIASDLNISRTTVRTHLRNIMAKLNVHSRLEAVATALRYKLIDPPY